MEALKETLSRALRVVTSLNKPANKSPGDSDHSGTKTDDILAFRTIITMLSFIQSPSAEQGKAAPTGTSIERQELSVLDALAALLVRQHEITAIFAKPYDGNVLQVFASVVHSNNTKPSLLFAQPGAPPGNEGLLDSFLQYIGTINPRHQPVNGHSDSLRNQTPLPYIVDPDDKVPADLVSANEDNRLLETFLQSHWGRESYETHVWMIKTLLGRSPESPDHLEALILYITAVCYEKMFKRMKNPSFSEPYRHCLLNQGAFPFLEQSSVAEGRNHDELFLKVIPVLAKTPGLEVDIHNLEAAAKSEEPNISIYNKSTYMEFHNLLCKFLRSFLKNLGQLQTLQKDMASSGNYDLVKILRTLKKVRASGHYLRAMVSGAAIEKYLQNIQLSLVVDTRKSWIDYHEDEDDDVVQFLKPNSMRKGQSLGPWQSYRDWLRLLVLYFDAAQVLAAFVATVARPLPVPITIKIFSPPLPDDKMVNWKTLLENERYFPPALGEISGKDLVTSLNSRINEPKKKGVDIGAVILSAQLLKQEHEMIIGNIEAKIVEANIIEANIVKANANIDSLSGQLMTCSSPGAPEDINLIKEKVVALKSCGFQDRLPRIQKILDMMATFKKRSLFYKNLSQGSLKTGTKAPGAHHCEAFAAPFCALLSEIRQDKVSQEKVELWLKELSPQDVTLLKALLSDFAGCKSTIGVSKRCCPVCAWLLMLLNRHYKTDFAVTDEHSNITPCTLSELLPGDIIRLMVVEFGRRLRKELTRLLESGPNGLRGRAGTSDTTRMSLDDTRPPEREGVVDNYAAEVMIDSDEEAS